MCIHTVLSVESNMILRCTALDFPLMTGSGAVRYWCRKVRRRTTTTNSKSNSTSRNRRNVIGSYVLAAKSNLGAAAFTAEVVTYLVGTYSTRTDSLSHYVVNCCGTLAPRGQWNSFQNGPSQTLVGELVFEFLIEAFYPAGCVAV